MYCTNSLKMPSIFLIIITLLSCSIPILAYDVTCNDAYPYITNITDCTTLVSLLPTSGAEINPQYTFPAAFRYRSCLVVAEPHQYTTETEPFPKCPSEECTAIFTNLKNAAMAVFNTCDMAAKKYNFGILSTITHRYDQRNDDWFVYRFKVSMRGNPRVPVRNGIVVLGDTIRYKFHNYEMDTGRKTHGELIGHQGHVSKPGSSAERHRM
jgi:hypothetical protein